MDFIKAVADFGLVANGQVEIVFPSEAWLDGEAN